MKRVPRGFQTAVDVEHGSRLFVLPYGRILLKFSTTKNDRVITLEVFIMKGNLPGFVEI